MSSGMQKASEKNVNSKISVARPAFATMDMPKLKKKCKSPLQELNSERIEIVFS